MRALSSLALAVAGSIGACSASTTGGAPALAPSASSVKHVIVVVQENHTFDAYFGRYCTAPPGSSPTCTDGPACCEAAPDVEPGAKTPFTPLTDAENAAYSPNHTQACEVDNLDGGKMDRFVTSTLPGCGSKRNFAVADAPLMQPYWDLAKGGALADRYFQPVAGQSLSNEQYLARARFVFLDNSKRSNAIGSQCALGAESAEYTDPTIGDLLSAAKVSWAFYADGYQAMIDAKKGCPPAPSDCVFGQRASPCVYDPGDDPFTFYTSTKDDPAHARDYAQLARDLEGDALPSVVFVKPVGYKSEHPADGTTITAGMTWVNDLVRTVLASPAAKDTLILVTYDEGGGYFDHVAPPPASAIDNQPYGTRIPLIALGPFARKNAISHVTMEHSSIVKFIEWNWLGQQTGQLGARDQTVANLGSLLDPATTGTAVPEN